MVELRGPIDANLDHGLSQGLIESTNTKIRLLTRIAFGFHGPQPLIALAPLALGSHPPPLPVQTDPRIQQKSDMTALMRYLETGGRAPAYCDPVVRSDVARD